MDRVKVLFVCSGNAHRSPLAEALLRNLRSDLVVDSAGIRAAIPVSEEVRAYLVKENAEQYLKRAPEGLDSKRLADYDVIVAMEQSHEDVVLSMCPECAGRVLVWDIPDPYFMSPDDAVRVYARIKKKVTELAASDLLQ